MTDQPEAPAPEPVVNPYLREVTEQDFLDWKHHPVTKLFRQWLADYGRALRSGHEELWLDAPAGTALDPVLASEMKGRVLTLAELHVMTFQSIQNFYADVLASEAAADQQGNDDLEAETDQN